MSMTLYPAIDIRDGRVVRLKQGDYTQETHYDDAPIQRIRGYAEAGATWLHLVDLDAARDGGYTLAPLLGQIAASTGLQVQTGGGVRSEADVEAILDAGASRVVVGSLAVREPARVMGWLKHFGSQRITLALDTRQDDEGIWRLPSHGWTADSGQELFALTAQFVDAGLQHLLCTDIARDGMMAGPNIGLYRELCQRFSTIQVQASGGVRGLEDIADAARAGCSGAVLGKALLEGGFALDTALATQWPQPDEGRAC